MLKLLQGSLLVKLSASYYMKVTNYNCHKTAIDL